MTRRSGWRAALLAATAAALGGCSSEPDAAFVVVVTASGTLPTVTELEVTVTAESSSSTRSYTRPGREPMVFPTTLSAELPSAVGREVTIEVRALEETRGTVALGHAGPLPVVSGRVETAYVSIACEGLSCERDGGGADTPQQTDAGPPGPTVACGNGRVDVGEVCDTAIGPGEPGRCPATCDDHVACTRDLRVGDGCAVTCRHEEITAPIGADGCCPADATALTDPDCSATCGNGAVDPGETCDLGIAPGTPGACPADEGACDDGSACSADLLISRGTCSAVCVHTAVTVQSLTERDACCPVGANALSDIDCPRVCGDGQVDRGETCDVAIPAPLAGSCPARCDDGDPCTRDTLDGTGCSAACTSTPVTALVSGDGCCPAGTNSAIDSDCPPACGNGHLERGETCDWAITSGPQSCPVACGAVANACLQITLLGTAEACSARCAARPVLLCAPQPDGCCPAGCTAANDGDCSPSCGNGVVDATETCDVAIASGPGACPSACSDGEACTPDLLLSAGTCHAACEFRPLITTPRAGDGCCPPGASSSVDPDCAPVCGNGLADAPWESCDPQIPGGSCPPACPAPTACTRWAPAELQAQNVCTSVCVATTITNCRDGDGCCPTGCDRTGDNDCPAICGNAAVEPGESCDKGTNAASPGACAGSCDDGDACTTDATSGSAETCTRACAHAPVTACLPGDGCCPSGCSASNDADCAPLCGDGLLGHGETCDPPSSCPAACPEDGDRCTAESLVGSAAECSAACVHVPITACGGAASDGCCPTSCTPESDPDC